MSAPLHRRYFAARAITATPHPPAQLCCCFDYVGQHVLSPRLEECKRKHNLTYWYDLAVPPGMGYKI